MADLIATCPVCTGQTHRAFTHGRGCRPHVWCRVAMRDLDVMDAIAWNDVFIVARIDGGDPGDEQEAS